MDRRNFLKKGVAAASVAALAACKLQEKRQELAEKREMEYRVNPGTGEKVSLLGYGCMRWPRKENELQKEKKQKYAPLDQDGINDLVDRAIACGVTYFDTAPVYCKRRSEEATGIALSRHDRSEYLIATKLSNFRPEDQSHEASVAMYKNSLRLLQVEYIDYYLLHSLGDSMEDFRTRYLDNGMMDYLLAERKAGRIRNLGFSFHGTKEVFDSLLALHDRYHWDFVQIQMNYMDWYHIAKKSHPGVKTTYLYEELEKRGIPIIIMEPLLGGRLADVPDAIEEQMKSRRPYDSIASWAMRFCASFPSVLTILSGMTYMEHLEDNVKTLSSFQPLSDDEMNFLKDVSDQMDKFPLVPCTACGYCMPCPYGIDIRGVFTHYNKCVNEGYVSVNEQDSAFRRARRKYLSSYVSSVEDGRAADKCAGCGACVSKCPQKIDIPKELRKIDVYVEKLRKSR